MLLCLKKKQMEQSVGETKAICTWNVIAENKAPLLIDLAFWFELNNVFEYTICLHFIENIC